MQRLAFTMSGVGKSCGVSAASNDCLPLTVVGRLDRPPHGLSNTAINRLRGLIAERGRAAWEVGDLLVDVYGTPPPAGVMDGSRARLTALAEVLGVSLSWLTATRIAAASWPRRERRPSVGWPVHRALSARPDRIELLADFVTDCERERVTPSVERLTVWLEKNSSVTSTVGRPKLDAVDRVVRMALALDRPQLERLVRRLREALAAEAAA